MKVSGVGSLTTKGLGIVDYCTLNDVSLSFKKFYATDKSVGLNVLMDPSDTTYQEMTDAQLITHLSASNYHTGNVAKSESIISSGYSILPILLAIESNDYTEDLQIKTIYITAKDQNGILVEVASGTSFVTFPQTVTFGAPITGYTGKLVCKSGNYLSITDIQDSLSNPINYDDFLTLVGSSVVGITGGTDGSSNFSGSSKISDLDFCIYKCCPSYEEVLTITLTSATGFSSVAPNNWISNAAGAKALISNIVGNVLTCVRQNTTQFYDLDNVDNVETYVAPQTTIALAPTVNQSSSTVIPITYLSDGSSILLRINLRHSTGWPKSLLFLNTSITEIEIHNADESDTHVDLRMQNIVNFSILASDIRLLQQECETLRDQLNTYRTANSWTGSPFVL